MSTNELPHSIKSKSVNSSQLNLLSPFPPPPCSSLLFAKRPGSAMPLRKTAETWRSAAAIENQPQRDARLVPWCTAGHRRLWQGASVSRASAGPGCGCGQKPTPARVWRGVMHPRNPLFRTRSPRLGTLHRPTHIPVHAHWQEDGDHSQCRLSLGDSSPEPLSARAHLNREGKNERRNLVSFPSPCGSLAARLPAHSLKPELPGPPARPCLSTPADKAQPPSPLQGAGSALSELMLQV